MSGVESGGTAATSELARRMSERTGDRVAPADGPVDELCMRVPKELIVEVCRALRDEEGFDLFVDLMALDLVDRRPRFDVVYNLHGVATNRRIFLKVGTDGDDDAVPSIVPVYAGANWFEREVWDMFGVRFDGHPNLKRILLYEEFVGHPLRKDYDVRHRQPLVGPKS